MSARDKELKRGLWNMDSISDLRNSLKEIEKDLVLNSNKILLTRLCNGFMPLTVLLEQKQIDIYPLVVSWFELYLKLLNFIDPKDKKLMQQYEKTVPTAISYIIGCLQHNPKDDFTFYFRLLEIIDALLKIIPPNVIKECSTLSNGTIACLWKPIRLAGDFNTQTLALTIFAKLLKNFDANRMENELKGIKWINLNLFKGKLNRLIEGVPHALTCENACRELLNNFNMELSTTIFIYSLDCEFVIMGNVFQFYKPLTMKKFWIDLNFRPKTVTFKGRHKLKNQFEFQDFDINLKWKNIQLKNNGLFIAIEKTKDSVLPPQIASKLKKQDKLLIYLTDKEIQHFKKKKDMMRCPDLFETEANDENTKVTENEQEVMSSAESNNSKTMAEEPVTPCSSSITKEKQYFLRQKTPKRKFFSTVKSENMKQKQTTKKNSNKKLSKILKPRNERKSVCKVVPVVVDLTKTPEHINTRPPSRVAHNRTGGTKEKLTVKQCLKILHAVNDTNKESKTNYNYDESDEAQYQSYHDFKAMYNFAVGDNERIANQSSGALRTGPLAKDDKPSKVCPPITELHRLKNSHSNKENVSRPLKSKKRKLLSQNLFDQLKHDGSESSELSKRAKLCSIANVNTENKLCPNNIPRTSKNSSECEELQLADSTNKCSTPLRSPQSYPNTPSSTNSMEVSITNNTVKQMDTRDHFLLKEPRTENKITNNSLFGAENNVVEKSFIDDQINVETKHDKISGSNLLIKRINYFPVLKDCVIYKNRLESDDSDSENENENGFYERKDLKSHSVAVANDSENIENPLNEVVHQVKVNQTIHRTQAVAQQSEINTEKTTLGNYDVKSIMLTNDTCNKKPFTLYAQALYGSLLSSHDIKENYREKYSLNIATQIADKLQVQRSIQESQPEKNKKCTSVGQSVMYGSLLSSHDIKENNREKYSLNIATQIADKLQVQRSIQESQPEKNKKCTSVGQSVKTQTIHFEYFSTKTNCLINKRNECLTTATDLLQAAQEPVNRASCLNENKLKLLGNKSNSSNLRLEEADLMNTDLYEMEQIYLINVENMFNLLHRQCVTETFTDTKSKLCALAENIVKQSNEHIKELNVLQAAIKSLFQQMESHYDLYVKRNEQFHSFQQSAETILNAFGCLSLQSDISIKYQDVIDKMNIAEKQICKEIWQKYFTVYKQNLMRTIDSLSEI